MLLKSSSTTVLSSLITSKEIINSESRSIVKVPASKLGAFSLGEFLSTPFVWPSYHIEDVRREDLCLQAEDNEWDFERLVLPLPSIKKVHSETHLQKIGHGLINFSSAKVPADVFRSIPVLDQKHSDGKSLSTHQTKWSRRTSLPRYCSLPADISRQHYSLPDKALFKLSQQKELHFTGENAEDEENATRDNRSSKLSCISKEHDSGRLNNLAELSNTKSFFEEDPRNIHSSMPVASDHRGQGVLQKQAAATSRGKDETCLVIDGECYTSTHVRADGVAVACNSRGCRPFTSSASMDSMFFADQGLGSSTFAKGEGAWSHAERGECRSIEAEAKFIKLLQENPGQSLLLRNYAHYLLEVRKDYAKAEEFFERAILEEPGDGELISDYAKLIWQLHEDEDRAGSYFNQAVQAAPDDCHVAAAYASFLWGSEDTNQNKEPSQSTAIMHEPVIPTLSA